MTFPLVLVAGATGAIGSEVVRALQARGMRVRALVREPARLTTEPEEIFVGNLLNPRTLEGVCRDVAAVVSSAGAKFQPKLRFSPKGESFRDVDDIGNRNLLQEEIAAGVRRFGYVSAYGGKFLGAMEYIRAHESFATALRSSGLDYLVVRPTMTFARVVPMVEDARKRGRISRPGTGQAQTNPIHEADIARALVDALEGHAKELDAGGPDVLTHEEIAMMAAEAVGGASVRFTLMWQAQMRAGLRRFTGRHSFDSVLYRLAEADVDMVAPVVGEQRLGDYLAALGGQAPFL